jgi:hypothetical protein
MSIFINRIMELEALGILWLELRAGPAVERGLKNAFLDRTRLSECCLARPIMHGI